MILYEQVYDWDNLLLAHRKASKGKRGKEPAACFEYHLEDNLVALRDELRSQTYQPGPYDSFYIHEPKRRLISAAPFRDRVVHTYPAAGTGHALRKCSAVRASNRQLKRKLTGFTGCRALGNPVNPVNPV